MFYSPLRKLRAIFKHPLPALVSRNNVLLITAYPKKGIVTVSYKGKAKRALFGDKTVSNLVKRVRFEENAIEFLAVVAQLLDQVTKK